jgi:hypothetical protein
MSDDEIDIDAFKKFCEEHPFFQTVTDELDSFVDDYGKPGDKMSIEAEHLIGHWERSKVPPEVQRFEVEIFYKKWGVKESPFDNKGKVS